MLLCYVCPCHHGMARPRVAGGGDGLQIWRVATSILDKWSRTADKLWSSRSGVGVGRGLTTPHRTKTTLLRNVWRDLRIRRILWNDLATENGFEIWTTLWFGILKRKHWEDVSVDGKTISEGNR